MFSTSALNNGVTFFKKIPPVYCLISREHAIWCCLPCNFLVPVLCKVGWPFRISPRVALFSLQLPRSFVSRTGNVATVKKWIAGLLEWLPTYCKLPVFWRAKMKHVDCTHVFVLDVSISHQQIGNGLKNTNWAIVSKPVVLVSIKPAYGSR